MKHQEEKQRPRKTKALRLISHTARKEFPHKMTMKPKRRQNGMRRIHQSHILSRDGSESDRYDDL